MVMKSEKIFYDIAKHSLNKKDEELCGDNVEIFKSDNRLTIVLADGLGSGVKANILSTLTTKIAGTMLQKGSSIEETINTVMNTLPVCNVRKIAYSTLAIIDINKYDEASIIQYDNPPVFYKRKGEIIDLPYKTLNFGGKNVKLSKIKLMLNDTITLVSDGVIHAGVGRILNHGWEWHHVADYLQKQNIKNSEKYNRRLVDTCSNLYAGSPGDDTTAVTLKIRNPEITNIFTGPPDNPAKDKDVVRDFLSLEGRKIICGGTAANIFSREMDKDISTSFDYIDPEVPPIGNIKGLDLVTEGILTLKKLLSKFELYSNSISEINFNKKDGATLLMKILLEESTHINIWFGRAVNPAHQNPDLPVDLSIKLNIVGRIANILKSFGKTVNIEYL